MRKQSGKKPVSTYLPGLTNFQWYFYQAHQTVFYAAFTKEGPTENRLNEIARDLIGLAPQLAEGFCGLHGIDADNPDVIKAHTRLEELDDLESYPDAFDVVGNEIFNNPNLGVFRVYGVKRKGGADDKGRTGAICIVASHTLLEGMDSVQFSRSQTNPRDLSRPTTPVPPLRNFLTQLRAWATAPFQIVIASFIAPRSVDRVFRGLSFERNRIRKAAALLGISQRSLVFALAMFALNDGGRGINRRRIYGTYVDLDPAYQGASGDSFFRIRMMEAHFPVVQEFADFARKTHARISDAEKKDATATQRFLTTIFGVHRKLKTAFPFLYVQRFFRFGGFYDIDLSMTPPHRLSGHMTRDMYEPVYCGTLHPALNVCVFVPNGDRISFSFTVQTKLAKNVDMVEHLLAGILSDTSLTALSSERISA